MKELLSDLQVLLALERIEQDEELSFEVFNFSFPSFSPIRFIYLLVENCFIIPKMYW